MDEQRPLLGVANDDHQARAVRDSDLEGGRASEHNMTWREWVAEVLESRRLHKTVITFIAIDAVCVLADLSYTFLSESCPPPSEESQPVWLEILSHISIAITTLFLLEIPPTIWAFGLRYYAPLGRVPHASLHLFDAVIIVATFVLEVVLRGRERELAGLLVLFRLWRLVKLVGGIAVGAGELNEELTKRLADAEQLLSEKSAMLQHLQEENSGLRSRLSSVENMSSFQPS